MQLFLYHVELNLSSCVTKQHYNLLCTGITSTMSCKVYMYIHIEIVHVFSVKVLCSTFVHVHCSYNIIHYVFLVKILCRACHTKIADTKRLVSMIDEGAAPGLCARVLILEWPKLQRLRELSEKLGC